jgi:hypothetical protein
MTNPSPGAAAAFGMDDTAAPPSTGPGRYRVVPFSPGKLGK